MRAHPFPLLAITPFERPDLSLARAFDRHGAAVAVDLGRNCSRHAQVLEALGPLCARSPARTIGIRIADQVEIAPAQAPAGVGFVVLGEAQRVQFWREHVPVIVQVTCEAEARAAITAGAAGLIAKGEETGGRVGQGSAFILLQRILAIPETRDIPVWCQGGMGLHTAAAAMVGGACGIVLDGQLALLHESTLPKQVKDLVEAMDGSETRVLGGDRVYSRPGTAIVEKVDLEPHAVRAQLGNESLDELLPIGQDASIARSIAAQYPN